MSAIDRLGSRKFLVTVGALVSVTVLTWFAKVNDGVYSTVVMACLGAYITGNVVQKWAEYSQKPEAKAKTVAPPE